MADEKRVPRLAVDSRKGDGSTHWIATDIEPCIFVAASDLGDETVLLCLRALEISAMRGAIRNPDDTRNERIVRSGGILAAEAWRRGLISAPTP